MENYIKYCLKLAEKNIKKEEVPVSAILIKDNKIIAKAVNKKNNKNDVLSHAEILCINKASKKLKRWNLNDCTMIVTLKPCRMCELIIKESRIDKVYYLLENLTTKKGYNKTKFAKIKNLDTVEKEYQQILKKFFENKR